MHRIVEIFQIGMLFERAELDLQVATRNTEIPNKRNFQPENPAASAAKTTGVIQVPRFGTGRIPGQ